MKRLLTLLLLGAQLAAFGAPEARQALREGTQAYREERFADAAAAFAAARKANEADGMLNADALTLAEANALLMARKHEEALNAYRNANPEDSRRARASYHALRGAAALELAKQLGALEAVEEGDLAAAIKQTEKAIATATEAFERNRESLRALPTEPDVKARLEASSGLIEELKRKLEELKQEQKKQQEQDKQDGEDDKEKEKEQQQNPENQEEQKNGDGTHSPQPTPTPAPQPTPQPTPEAGSPEKPDPQEQERNGQDGAEPQEGEIQLSPEDAAKLLEALMDQEKRMRELQLHARPIPVEKDY